MRFKSILNWCLLATFFTVAFTNCENYNQNTIPPQVTSGTNLTSNTPVCDEYSMGPECAQERARIMELRKVRVTLTSGKTAMPMTFPVFTVNLGGTCFKDIFPTGEIYYTLTNPTTGLSLTNNPSGNTYPGSNWACQNNGTWQISIPLYGDSGTAYYDNTSVPFDYTKTHILVVELVVRDENGTYYLNPLLAKDTITLFPPE